VNNRGVGNRKGDPEQKRRGGDKKTVTWTKLEKGQQPGRKGGLGKTRNSRKDPLGVGGPERRFREICFHGRVIWGKLKKRQGEEKNEE